jgi:hypothetical protein
MARCQLRVHPFIALAETQIAEAAVAGGGGLRGRCTGTSADRLLPHPDSAPRFRPVTWILLPRIGLRSPDDPLVPVSCRHGCAAGSGMEDVAGCREDKGIHHSPPVRIIPSDAPSVSVFTVINEPPGAFLNKDGGQVSTAGLGVRLRIRSLVSLLFCATVRTLRDAVPLGMPECRLNTCEEVYISQTAIRATARLHMTFLMNVICRDLTS